MRRLGICIAMGVQNLPRVRDTKTRDGRKHGTKPEVLMSNLRAPGGQAHRPGSGAPAAGRLSREPSSSPARHTSRLLPAHDEKLPE